MLPKPIADPMEARIKEKVDDQRARPSGMAGVGTSNLYGRRTKHYDFKSET